MKPIWMMEKYLGALSSSFCTQLVSSRTPFQNQKRTKSAWESTLYASSFNVFDGHVLPWEPLWGQKIMNGNTCKLFPHHQHWHYGVVHSGRVTKVHIWGSMAPKHLKWLKNGPIQDKHRV